MVQSLVIGVDIGHHSIKAVVLKPAGYNYTLLGYQEICVTNDIFAENHSLVYQEIVKKLKQLKKALPQFSKKAVIAIPDNTVISKLLQIDSELEANERESAIYQAFSHQSPFPIEEVRLDFVPITPKSAEKENVSKNNLTAYQVYATKREVVESRTLPLEKAGFVPMLADVQSHSLVHLWQLFSQAYQRPDWMLVDIGLSQTSLCFDFLDKPFFYKQIQLGIEPAIQGSTDALDLPQNNRKNCHELVDKIAKQIQLFTSVYGANTVSGIWLTGGGANIAAIQEALVDKTDLMCGILDPFSLFTDKASKRHSSQQLSSSFATAAGLALRGLRWLEVERVA